MTKWLLAAGVLMPLYSAQATQDPEASSHFVIKRPFSGQLPMAPRKGDQEAWTPRLAKGMETLVQHVTQGFKAMPPRGLCMDCSAEDYRAIIQWMSE